MDNNYIIVILHFCNIVYVHLMCGFADEHERNYKQKRKSLNDTLRVHSPLHLSWVQRDCCTEANYSVDFLKLVSGA